MMLKGIPQIQAWVKWNLAHQRDVNIELRGPKGYGKSSFAFWLRRLLKPNIQGFSDLVLTHQDYVRRFRELRKIRKDGDDSIQFLWVDDATRIFNRRAALTAKNRAILDLNRTMRTAVQAVQFMLTQDDLLERPLQVGGPYVLLVFDRPHHFRYAWMRRDPLLHELKPILTWGSGFPNPETAFPEEWAEYKQHRSRLTDELDKELLQGLGRSRRKPGAKPTVDRKRILALLRQGKSQVSVARLCGTTQSNVSQILAMNGRR